MLAYHVQQYLNVSNVKKVFNFVLNAQLDIIQIVELVKLAITLQNARTVHKLLKVVLNAIKVIILI
jgi:hypothetical protein